MMHDKEETEEQQADLYKKGRGAQFNTRNRFLKNEVTREHVEAIDDWVEADVQTNHIEVFPKSIVNKVDSPDVGM